LRARVLKSDALLLLAAAVWGLAFVAQRMGMAHVGPFTFNAVRFALGAAVLLPVMRARRGPKRAPSDPGGGGARTSLYALGLAGPVLFAGASLQQVGIVYTTAGKAGFITGLYVVMVPMIGLLLRRRPSGGGWAGAGLAAAGLYLLSVTGGLEVSRGDALVLASALFFAVHVLVIGWLSPRMDAIRLAFLQFATCSALSFAFAAGLEPMDPRGIAAAAGPILYAGVLSVGVAYTLQAVSQREAPPGHAAVILSLEAVFAAAGGGIILGEHLSPRALSGCALMLAGAVVSKIGATARRTVADTPPRPPR
jgi:drug/metabolite transporter (DMT)-like permease